MSLIDTMKEVFSPAPTLPSVPEAAAALQRANDARDKIISALASVKGPDEADQTALAELQRVFEDAAADHAVGTGKPAAVAKAREALEAAQAQAARSATDRAASDAQRAGLQRRLATAELDVQAHEVNLREAEVQFLRAELVRADTAYLEAANAAWSAWQRIDTIHEALGVRGAKSGMQTKQPILTSAGPVSEAAALRLRPSEPHGWGLPVHPPRDVLASIKGIEHELSTLANPGQKATT